MFISVCGSRITLWKSQKYYMVWILFYFWSLGHGANDFKLALQFFYSFFQSQFEALRNLSATNQLSHWVAICSSTFGPVQFRTSFKNSLVRVFFHTITVPIQQLASKHKAQTFSRVCLRLKPFETVGNR
jgi:ABC-type maltose transport system permease subunit